MSLDTIAIALFGFALLFKAAEIYLRLRRQKAKRRNVKREARELEYAIERDKPNPLRVVGGHAGPDIVQPEGRKRVGL